MRPICRRAAVWRSSSTSGRFPSRSKRSVTFTLCSAVAQRPKIFPAGLVQIGVDRIDPRADQLATACIDDPGSRDLRQTGDLLCDVLTSARFQYRTVEDRRRDMGSYAPAHCDIVVKVAADRILVIGGNILGAVTLAVWPTERAPAGYLRPVDSIQIDGVRNVFAHLKLRANPIEVNAMDNSPTIRALNAPPPPPPGASLPTEPPTGPVQGPSHR